MTEYIEREVLIAELAKCTIISDDLYCMGIMAGVDAAKKKVYEVQAADVALVRHGRWIYHAETIHTLAHTRCSVCSSIRYEHYVKDFRFCPSCGARMDGGESDA